MNKFKSIQLKAAFLLIVFSMNTFIGLACAVGFDMVFNANHHEKEVADISIHVHADGKHHEHSNEIKNHQEEADNQLHKTNKNEHNCCHDKVTQIAQQHKAIAPSVSKLSPVIFTIYIGSFYDINLLSTLRDSHIRYYIRNHHPPIPDIRVAIQSFQI